MNPNGRERKTMRRAQVVGVTLALLGSTWLAGGAAGLAPDSVIDAGADAQEAADAINQGCADLAACEWKDDGDLTTEYGPEKVIGDVLYNCSTGDSSQQALTASGVTDERGEATSLSEEISLEASLGFLDMEKSSVEFSAYSKQSQKFSSQVKVTSAVTVPPGYKGWTQARVLSGSVTGSAYITQGIHLTQVKDIDMQFPGYQGPDVKTSKPQVVYSGVTAPITTLEMFTYCPTVLQQSRAASDGTAARLPKERQETFKITVCRGLGKHSAAPRQCVRREVTGLEKPPHRQRVTAKLMRAGVVYAVERNRRGGVNLVQRRDIRPGRYTLVIREQPRRMVVKHHGKRLHRARQEMFAIVPLRIDWSRRG